MPPGTRSSGVKLVDKFAGDLRATHPHFALHAAWRRLRPSTMPVRLIWGSGPRGEAPDYTGIDVITRFEIARSRRSTCSLDSMPSYKGMRERRQ